MHYNKVCKSSNCKKCNQPHNTLLHFDRNIQKSDNDNGGQSNVEEPQQSSEQNSVITAHTSTKQPEYILLSTAVVLIKDFRNNLVQCRALTDSGSQSNFMTKELVEKLRLKQSNISIPIGQIKLGDSKPILQKTKLGWLISGALVDCQLRNKISCNLSINTEVLNKLEKFWKIEELPDSEYYSKEELSCENHFETTFKREQDGRFIVSLPLKENHANLGESLGIAEKRLISMEKKFVRSFFNFVKIS
ncbi:hypothetical protein QE152_g31923 [Popillia japonica]|uniref:Peptidase aspartic putative domain-containing protein n=1 Tax=Popillia japonica TaxID=7064 RepID=A0AAW1J0U8_POPJA